MKSTFKFIVLGVGMYLLSLKVYAQDFSDPVMTIPFHFVDNTIFLQAKGGDGENIAFYFDTGATTTILDEKKALELGYKAENSMAVSGGGGTNNYKTIENTCIYIKGEKFDGFVTVLDDLSRLQQAVEYSFDGVIGLPILEKFITEIDMDKKVMNLYRKGSSLRLEGYKSYDITFRNGIKIPHFPVQMELFNGTTYEGEVLFDSGADLALMVNTPFKNDNKIKEQADKIFTTVSNNFTNSVKSEKIAIKKLNVFGNSFLDVPISLSTSTAGVTAFPNYLGILGAEIIYRYNFILDYDKMKLYLKPSKDFYRNFEYPLIGIKIKKNDAGEVFINSVSEHSELYKQGIRPGDILLSVNGNKSNNLQEYRDLFTKEGETVTLVIKGADGIKTFYSSLSRQI